MCRLSRGAASDRPGRPDPAGDAGPTGQPGAPGIAPGIETLLARLVGDQQLGGRALSALLLRLAALLGASARAAGARAVGGGRWLGDIVLDVAPHVPVRDLPTLRAHHPGRTGDELAEALIAAASRATAGVGAAGGALATAEFAAPPALLSAPVQLAAETLAVVTIELKLVAELHEVYGAAVPGTGAERATAYVGAWARRRGVDPFNAGRLGVGLGGAARRELRQRVVRRVGRNMSTFAPFLAGAVAGAELNRRETRKLGAALTEDLRGRAGGWYRP